MVVERMSRAVKAPNYEETLLRRKASRVRVLRLLERAIPLLRESVNDENLTDDARQENAFAIEQLEQFEAKLRSGKDWPTVKMRYFIDPKNPAFQTYGSLFKQTKAATLLRFLLADIGYVRSTFTRFGATLPSALEILHREYWGHYEKE